MKINSNTGIFVTACITILILLIFITPQSFAYVKLPFLGFSLAAIFFGILKGKYKKNNILFFPYYAAFGFLTIIWAFVGILRGNSGQAIIESVNIYFVYMWIYCILIIHISSIKYQKYIDNIFCFSAIGISFFCFYTLLDSIYGLAWFGSVITTEMLLVIGINDGYTQMNNINVGMFSFIIPYILSRVIIGVQEKRHILIISLVISVVALILASRRIVLVLFFIAPILSYLLKIVISGRDKVIRERVFKFYILISFVVISCILFYYYYDPVLFEGFSDRMISVFIQDDLSERQLQNYALIKGFYKYPIFGSGFGGLTDVIRSDERPWTFELTYSRILFNSGLVGVALLLVFNCFFIFAALKKIRNLTQKSIYISLLVGFFCVSIASTSNPYMNSFDFIFVLSIIPLILNTKEINRSTQV